MAPDSTAKPARGGLSLYANLLDSSSKNESKPGTISGAAVLYRQEATGEEVRAASTDKQQINAASLRFQPTKRPQLQAQKPKAKPSTQRTPLQSSPANATINDPPDISVTTTRPQAAKPTLADWTADGDDNDVNGFYGVEKRQRGGRKKKRKTDKAETVVFQNWDDIYDPSRPNTYENYKNSDEKIAEIREWKDRLYAHRMVRRHSSGSRSDSEDGYRPQISYQFAPPLSLNFAPPPTLSSTPPPPPPPEDATGEGMFARGMRLSQRRGKTDNSPPPPPPPPPPAGHDSKIAAQPPAPSVPAPSISRAPIRYCLPLAPSEIPSSEAELATALESEQASSLEEPQEVPQEANEDEESTAQRSLRPGQKGFAERLMSKYGWSKGSGLGASGSGIVNPLRVQVEKQKKKPDSEGGGFAGPGGMGKILGGKKKGGVEKGGKFGTMSEVVVLRGMVDGMDLDAEMGGGDGGLMQEIGEECGVKYGRVERVFVNRSNPAKAPVFVKFTSALSALRAVNALEGRIFNGNAITAKFFETEKFERGEYE